MVKVPYQVAIVTNKNNTREVEGVTHHLKYLFMGRENCTSLVHVHGVKDDLSLGFEWVVNCSSLCHVSHTA